MEIIVIYLIFINILAIGATAIDKRYAIQGKRRKRIPESTLLMLALLGGCLSMYITMLTVRHKTKKPKFMIMLPIIIMLEVALVFVLKRKGVI